MHRSKATANKPLTTMERKVPKSTKYAHISGVLNTGLTIDKVKSVTAREYAKRRDEIFYRLTKQQLFELYQEYEADEEERITDTRHNNAVHIVTYTEESQPVYAKPYLLLDLREIEDYRRCHLKQARSYPYAMLRRDQYHPDMYQFRNIAEKLIIVYCEDERISRLAAKDLVDRGIDNVFLLTGGMNEFAYEFPSFCEGDTVPSPPRSKQLPRRLLRIMEDEEDNNNNNNTNSHLHSPPSKLTANKLEQHNSRYASTNNYANNNNNNNNRDMADTRSRASGHYSSRREDFQQSMFPAASVLTTARSNRLTNTHNQGLYNTSNNNNYETRTQHSSVSVAESVISRATARKGKF